MMHGETNLLTQFKAKMQHFDVFAWDIEPYAGRPVVNQIIFLNFRTLEIFKKAITEESQEKERLQAQKKEAEQTRWERSFKPIAKEELCVSKETLIQFIPELKALI
jgi:hypothetical protein